MGETQEARRCCSAAGERGMYVTLQPTPGALSHVPNSLPQIITLSEHLFSSYCVLCPAELYLVLEGDTFKSHGDLLQMSEKRTAHLREEKTCQGCRKKRVRSAEWLYARSALRLCCQSPEAETTKASGNYFCRLTVRL